MTNAPQQAPAPAQRILLPGMAVWFFFLSPFLILFGGFLAWNASRFLGFDWANFQFVLGQIGVATGVLFLLVAVILTGVRRIAQQHLDAVLRVGRDQER